MIARKTRTVLREGAAAARSGFTLMEVLIVVAIIVVLAGVGTFYVLPLLGQSKEKIAKAQTATIADACETYSLNNNGNPPPTIQALTQRQPDGGKAILEPKAIIDPWGKEFTLDTTGSHHDGNKPDVYTVSPDGKTIGNW